MYAGSGKTTLLDILAGVIPDGDGLTGDVLFNGRPSTAVQRRAQCAYVLQVCSPTAFVWGGFPWCRL